MVAVGPIEIKRTIFANDRAYNSQFNYANNHIKTSKYTLFTFLPLNLFEQFQRLANFYFLCLLILQIIPVISSLTPITTAVPLIGVLSLTAAKDAYDDIQRHRTDRRVNNRKSKVLQKGNLVEEKWHRVQVGDVIRMESNQFIAADIFLLSSSNPNGLCYIETAELDGETNLKSRQCEDLTNNLGDDVEALSGFKGQIICEPPNNNLSRFEGQLLLNDKRYALDNDNIVLRGAILRNTAWCYGVVIFAGKDTKLMQNSGKTKFKRTSIDKLLNFVILGIVFFLLCMCLFCTIACGVWETITGEQYQLYLPWDTLIPTSPVSGATVIAILIFFSYAIVLNTVVPISLYVSVEVIRLVLSFLIGWDLQMYYKKTDTPAKARTTTLNEELGQIEYVFSDKTGTLTQNIMTFNKCSINGKCYGDILEEGHVDLGSSESSSGLWSFVIVKWVSRGRREIKDQSLYGFDMIKQEMELLEEEEPAFRLFTDVFSRFIIRGAVGQTNEAFEDTENENKNDKQKHVSFNLKEKDSEVGRKVDFSANPLYDPNFEFFDRKLLDDVRRNNENVHEFFRLMALCHTVMPEINDQGSLEYQAQSPDENALVSAARNFGFVFTNRTPRSITILVNGQEEVYDLLCILDFNNVRKRMSVVVKREGKIKLYCKGADVVILERLRPGQEDIIAQTQDHLDKFATDGLRTLLFASKDLSEQEFSNWKQAHHNAAIALENREEKLDEVYNSLEKNLNIIGATAIEDKLQDGVAQTIANLQSAGIKIWVLTGDKQETAINIGYSCQLLSDDLTLEPLIIDGNTFDEVQLQLVEHRRTIQEYLAPSSTVKAGMPFGTIRDSVSMQTLSSTYSIPDPSPSPKKMMGGNAKASSQSETTEDSDESTPSFALVVNGHSLVHALTPRIEKLFIGVAECCTAVICCRVTPLQKAMVVELVKRYKKAVTLAIGDGANDVSMIKAAHIGVGISGQEGMQAVLASDFSIAQFKFLERLLLVHGRWSYYRMCKFLRYFFYKNFSFTLCHFWYAFFCGFSAQTLFEPFFIALYNVFYSSYPVLAMAVFDQDVNAIYSKKFPLLFTPGIQSSLFNKLEIVKSTLHGIITSFFLFFISYGAYHNRTTPSGTTLSDQMTFGSVVATNLVIVVTAQIALDTAYWTAFNHITIWGSLCVFFLLQISYSYFIGGRYIGTMLTAMSDLTFWLTCLLTTVIVLVPVVAWRFFKRDVHPTLTDKVRYIQKRAKLKPKEAFRPFSGRRSRRSIRSGYAFSHQEGFGRLITSGKIMKRQPPTNAFQTTSSTLEPPPRLLTNQVSQISQGTIREDPEDEAVPENSSRKPLSIKINGHMREIAMPNTIGDNT